MMLSSNGNRWQIFQTRQIPPFFQVFKIFLVSLVVSGLDSYRNMIKLTKNSAIFSTLAAASLGTLISVKAADTEKQKIEVKTEEAAAVEVIKALLVTGEGYHDYAAQKKIITEGTTKLNAKIEWTIWHHEGDNAGQAAKDALSAEGWSDPFDIIVYNICHAKEKDQEFVDGLVAHHKTGVPCVAIHCTLHSYHWELNGGKKSKSDKEWNKLLGVKSTNHGPKLPITVTKVKGLDHPITANMPEQWKTKEGELYNIDKVYPTATILANGNNGKKGKKKQGDQPVIWVNKYGKANVFGMSLGHHNSTVESPQFLQTLTDGIVWAVNETKKEAKPEE